MTQVNPARPRREDGSPSNWDRYLDLSIRRQVPTRIRQWSIQRFECPMRSARCDLPELKRRRIAVGSRLWLVDPAQVRPGHRLIWTIPGMDTRTLDRAAPR